MLKTVLVSACLAAASTTALADTITTFDFSGSISYGGSPVSGTIVIDTTTGHLLSQQLTADLGDAPEYHLSGAGQLSYPGANITQLISNGGSASIFLLLPTASLVGYTGGSLCSGTLLDCDGYYSTFSRLFNNNQEADTYALFGSLTATPEPSTLLLLATGVLATATQLRRRLF